ncbi:unnamed protein product [Phytomonas sp. Hart1]|nr:unnamed protein product [Phytomonas sp. Hart1]|eukprot:CCW67723.1 unnamed protein product [Phytomonas sp. isolate Hart1]
MLSTLTPFIPTHAQIRSWGYPDDVRDKLERLALALLRRLFAPLVRRWRGRRARLKLLNALLHRYLPDQRAKQRCLQAILSKSAIAQATPLLRSAAAGEGLGKDVTKAPLTEVRFVGEEEGDLGNPRVGGRPPGEKSSRSILFSSIGHSTGTDPTAKRESLSFSSSQSQIQASQTLKEAISNVLDLNLRFRAYLQGEMVQWPMEPAHEVLILLEGTFERVEPRKVGAEDSHPGRWSQSRSKFPSFSISTMNSSLEGTYPPPIFQAGGKAKGLSQTSCPSGGGMDSSTTSRRWQGKLFPLDYTVQKDWLSAPAVLGEIPCIGGFPFCAEIVVHSEQAVIASIPFDIYCRIVSLLPLNSQRKLLTQALKQRELLMPYFAPMTRERLSVCPFLSRLRSEDVNHLREYLVPKVYASGMLCSEGSNPKHIFFIRRGIVCVDLEHQNITETFSSSCPRSRTLLTEGHTFGEAQCISRERIKDLFYAVSHVDMYILRFDILIRLMEQWPVAHKDVIIATSVLNKLNSKEAPSLSFSLSGVDITLMRNAAKHQNIMFELANLHSAIAMEDSGDNLISGRQGGAVLERQKSSAVFSPGTPLNSVKCCLTSARNGVLTSSGSSFIVRGDPSRFVKIMKRIPLLGLIVKEEDLTDLSIYWRCSIFEKGDFIVRRGEECNHLFYFSEGQAGVILDENRFRQEVKALSPLADFYDGEILNFKSLSTEELFPIPSGHTIGYTCVRRHRWTHSIIAMEDHLEVWVLERSSLVSFLWKSKLDHQMQSAALQLLQPLYIQRDRIPLLDYQPLLSLFPNSLWSEHPMPNMHPVSVVESKVLYPIWQEGDFPLPL